MKFYSLLFLSALAFVFACGRAEQSGTATSTPPNGTTDQSINLTKSEAQPRLEINDPPVPQTDAQKAVPAQAGLEVERKPTVAPAKDQVASLPGQSEQVQKNELANIFIVAKFDSGQKGVPEGWELDSKKGTPQISVVKDGNAYALHLVSDSESSFGIKKGASVDIKEYPYINWRWKAVRLPAGGDVRNSSKDDQVIQIYVAFPATGWPSQLNTPVVGYIWDNEAPKGYTGRSPQTGGDKLRYVVVRNKTDQLGEWYTEKRNIYQDYKKLFANVKGGEPLGFTRGIQIHINSSIQARQPRDTWGRFFSAKIRGRPFFYLNIAA